MSTRPRTIRAGAMAASMAAVTAGMWLGSLSSIEPGRAGLDIPWWVVALLFAAAEANVVHLHVGGDAHSFSLSEVALVLGLFALPPGGLVVAVMTGGALALVVRRRQSPLKLAFNLSHFALTTSLAALAFHRLLPEGGPVSAQAWWATAGAVIPAAVLGSLLIEVVIALCQGRAQPRRLTEVLSLATLATTANTSIGLVAVTLLATEPAAIWMLLVPGGALFLAYRAYLAERRQREQIEFLYEASRVLQRSGEVERVIPALLAHAGETFRAGLAELVLHPRAAGDLALRAQWRAGDTVSPMRPLPPDPGDMVTASVAADDGGLLLTAGHRPHALPGHRRFRDAIVAPVEGEGGPIGTIMLANRLGEVSTFTRGELHLLETLAHQVGVALENGELERSLGSLRERQRDLERRALHDPLTGLPNRALFWDRLEHALHRRTTAPLAVLFLDLDGFKDLNDRLGHAAGDDALGQVAERIRSCLRPADTAGRLGGDEFAVLVERVGPASAVAVAMRVLESLQMPVHVAGRPVSIGASVGVAVGAPGSVTADALLQRADAAMYRAKRAGKGTVEVDPGEAASDRATEAAGRTL